jgi:glycosyltransferase involved in cell wall biosynthesis
MKIVLTKTGIADRVIIIDVRSTDRTAEVVANAEAEIDAHTTNKGKGVAFKTGFEAAKVQIIVTMDSDGQHNPVEISKLIAPILKDEMISLMAAVIKLSYRDTTAYRRKGQTILDKITIMNYDNCRGEYVHYSMKKLIIVTDKFVKNT